MSSDASPIDPTQASAAPAVAELPRLLYVGDVPVESSYHGSALLYRLLQSYPPDRLQVIENLWQSQPQRRLPGVCYRLTPSRLRRLLHTRLHPWVSSLFSLTAAWRWRRLARLAGDFRPQAVLTVAHGYSWLTAAALAGHWRLPLHLVIHDDWPRGCLDLPVVKGWIDRQFQRCYQQAASRLCVSPFMVEDYQRRYGVQGTVLYPCRAEGGTVFPQPPQRLRQEKAACTVVFAGTVCSASYRMALRLLADSLTSIGGRLVIYGPLQHETSADIHQGRPNVEIRGLVDSQQLVQRCRAEADVLFVPMSFEPRERSWMEIAFPSKLTDYTAIGLPLLVYGPPYCSAVRWARENPGVAEVVTEESAAALSAALENLRQPQRRWELALAALRCGNELFDYHRVASLFFQSLRSG